MKAVFGLGNPGKKYQSTRHNFGFLVLDALAKFWGVQFVKYPSLNAEVAKAQEGMEEVWLIKPHTFMNSSGRCVAQFLKESGMSPLQFIVIVDDVSLPFGMLRYRDKGSSGGHNGLKSIEGQLHTQEYARLRCGIGMPSGVSTEEVDMKEYVLADFTAEEKNSFPDVVQAAVEAVKIWVSRPLEVNSWLGRWKSKKKENTDLV